MSEILNSTKASALIRLATGRSCTRQNLEQLCGKGVLTDCVVQVRPLRINSALLVAEYLRNVPDHQQPQVQRKKARPDPAPPAPPAVPVPAAPSPVALDPPPSPPSPPPRRRPPRSQVEALPTEPSEIPPYNDSRARAEWEKANLLEMQRKERAGQLLPREDVEAAWDAACNITRTRLLGVASTMKQRIPHLTPDEVELARDLIREALDELAAGDVTQRYPEVEA